MSPALDMENIRQQIRAAMDTSPHKSRKELAKLLGISPTQVTSLLKSGGRRLQAAEVPIVERYLGISLLGRDGQAVPERPLRPESITELPSFLAEDRSPFEDVSVRPVPIEQPLAASMAAAPRRSGGQASLPGVDNEGRPVLLADLPEDIARYLSSVTAGRQAEIWQLATDLVEGAGYLVGDLVVVDRGQTPRAHDVVMAEVGGNHVSAKSVFRVYVPPYLLVVSPRAMLQSPLLVDDTRVVIIGVIVGSLRSRGG
jgi:hypothetical protein